MLMQFYDRQKMQQYDFSNVKSKKAIDVVRTPNYQETIEAAPNLIKHHNFTFGLILFCSVQGIRVSHKCHQMKYLHLNFSLDKFSHTTAFCCW